MDKNCGDISSDGTNEWKDDGTNINRMDRDAANTERSGGIQRSENIQSNKSNGYQFIRNGRKRNATNTNSIGQKRRMYQDKSKTSIRKQFSKSDACNDGQARWENFPTESPLCYGDDGLSNRLDSITFSKWRNESIKAGGNAIVPQVVHQIFKSIEEYERLR